MIIYIVKLAHLLLVIFVFLSIIIQDNKIKQYALTILLFILYKYIVGEHTCGLTHIEYMLSGKEYESGFIYRIIKPILTIPENYFEKYLFIIHCLWIIILLYQLYSID
jgi:hypothetical protein